MSRFISFYDNGQISYLQTSVHIDLYLVCGIWDKWTSILIVPILAYLVYLLYSTQDFFSNFTLVFVTTAVYLNQLVQKLPSVFHGTILWSLLIDFIPMPYLCDELLIMKSFFPIQSNSSSFLRYENESYSSIATSYATSSLTMENNSISMDSTQQGFDCFFANAPSRNKNCNHRYTASFFLLLLSSYSSPKIRWLSTTFDPHSTNKQDFHD